MHEPFRVRRVQRAPDLGHQRHRHGGVHRPVTVEPRLQILPLHETRDEEQRPVGLPCSMHREDVRVLDRSRQPRLAQKPLAKPWILGQLRRHQLQRHRAVKGLVPCPVDDTHPAPTHDPLDPVAGEGLARG